MEAAAAALALGLDGAVGEGGEEGAVFGGRAVVGIIWRRHGD